MSREYVEEELDVTRDVIIRTNSRIAKDVDIMLILVEGCDKSNPTAVLATVEELESRMQSLKDKL